MMWGSAADPRYGYFPLNRTDERLGLTAVDLASGEVAWRASPPDGGGAPVTVMPGVVFFGATSGVMHAYSTRHARAKRSTVGSRVGASTTQR